MHYCVQQKQQQNPYKIYRLPVGNNNNNIDKQFQLPNNQQHELKSTNTSSSSSLSSNQQIRLPPIIIANDLNTGHLLLVFIIRVVLPLPEHSHKCAHSIHNNNNNHNISVSNNQHFFTINLHPICRNIIIIMHL
jgi:hypothetical protein